MKILLNLDIRKQIVLLLLILLTPAFITNWYSNTKAEGILTNQVTNAYTQLIVQNQNLIDKDISSIDKISRTIIQNPLTQDMKYNDTDTVSDRVRKYLSVEDLLRKYSLGINSEEDAYYSLIVPEQNNEYAFAPDFNSYNQGVFFVPKDHLPKWYKEAIQLKGKGQLKIINDFGPNGKKTLAYIREVNNVNQGDMSIGVLVVTHVDVMINSILKNISLPKGKIFFIGNDNTVYSGNENRIGDTISFPAGLLRKFVYNKAFTYNSSKSIYVIYCNSDNNYKLAYQIPILSLTKQQNNLKRSTLTLGVIYTVICIIVILYFFRLLVNPLYRVTHFLKSYKPGDQPPKINKMNRKDEVGVLINSVYYMTERINTLIHDKYEMEIKQKESQLQMLYEQINPHLLYNTLESIYWKSSLNGDKESSEMIKELSKLMRIGLSKGKGLIPVEKEIEHVRAYIHLQQLRFDYDFKISWNIDEEALGALIPKITLQPLVENSILHGVKNMGADGEINISTEVRKDTVIIAVADNGYKKTDLKYIQSHLENKESDQISGFGIKNVHKRIQMHFGDQYGLTYLANEPFGIRVKVKLPKTMISK